MLEFCSFWGSWEWDDVADVGHAGNEEHKALKPESEARVGHCAEAACVEIPPHVFHRDVEFLDASEKFVVTLLALRAADYFANHREEHVHCAHCLAVLVEFHIEGFDFLGVVGEDYRLLEMLFHEVAFVLALQVDAPRYGEFKFFA